MTDRIPLAAVHGRFQPPHNGHVRYILAALDRADHVFVGICTPAICTPEEAASTGYPCTAAENPFTFAQRAEMLTLALEAAGIAQERYSFADFPSDYAGVTALFPTGTAFFLASTGNSDTAKATHLERLGLATETVITLPNDEWRERGGDIRQGLADGTDDWARLVPPAIAEYLRTRGA